MMQVKPPSIKKSHLREKLDQLSALTVAQTRLVTSKLHSRVSRPLWKTPLMRGGGQQTDQQLHHS